MATILKLDETSGLDATTQDTTVALPTALSSAIGASTIIERAESPSISLPLTADTLDIAFTNQNGTPLNGVDSGLLTIDGRKIFLYTSATNNNIVFGRVGNADGTANASVSKRINLVAGASYVFGAGFSSNSAVTNLLKSSTLEYRFPAGSVPSANVGAAKRRRHRGCGRGPVRPHRRTDQEPGRGVPGSAVSGRLAIPRTDESEPPHAPKRRRRG